MEKDTNTLHLYLGSSLSLNCSAAKHQSADRLCVKVSFLWSPYQNGEGMTTVVPVVPQQLNLHLQHFYSCRKSTKQNQNKKRS